MFQTLQTRLKRFERWTQDSFGNDVSTPERRRGSTWHAHFVDNGWLRVAWTNFDRIAPGAYRANQPDGPRLEHYARIGMRAILSLRGEPNRSAGLLEQERCAELGLDFHHVRMLSRGMAETSELIKLLDLFHSIERPFLMHCMSGADRAGLAAALYLLEIERAPVAVARRQLSPRYLHFRHSRTGALDHMLDVYARDGEARGIGIRDWIERDYHPRTIENEWRASRGMRLRGEHG